MAVINVKRPGAAGAYTPYGGALEAMRCKDHQFFLYGSAGCGKTTALCWKMHLLCLKYPGVKFLFTRKSYRSLIKSGVETYERVVRESGMEIGKKSHHIKKLGETEPREFVYPHAKYTIEEEDGTRRTYEGRSRIVLASLDRVYDEMGAEYDYVYVNQPEQIEESDWEYLATRANGRRGVAPYPQLFGDPNPEHERHWIKRYGFELNAAGEREGQSDRWRLIKSTYRDNPVIWDMERQEFTRSGEEQIGRLQKSLSPVMAKRLIEGEWASFEGLVFGDSWDRTRHTITYERFMREYDITYWKRYWAVDFGFNDPMVVSMWARHPERELWIRYRYLYMSDRTINENAETLRAHLLGEPRPELVIADRNPQEIAVLQQALGMNIVTAKKGAGSIKAGINVLTDLIKNDSLLFVLDTVIEEDRRLRSLKKPIGFEEEVENYRWNTNKKTTNEEPVGGDDHEIDAVRYLFTHLKASEKKVKFVWI